MGDKLIPANSFVLGLVGSANRDEDFFGASLARVQAQVSVGRLVRRFPGLTLAGDTWKTRTTIRAATAVPVTV